MRKIIKQQLDEAENDLQYIEQSSMIHSKTLQGCFDDIFYLQQKLVRLQEFQYFKQEMVTHKIYEPQKVIFLFKYTDLHYIFDFLTRKDQFQLRLVCHHFNSQLRHYHIELKNNQNINRIIANNEHVTLLNEFIMKQPEYIQDLNLIQELIIQNEQIKTTFQFPLQLSSHSFHQRINNFCCLFLNHDERDNPTHNNKPCCQHVFQNLNSFLKFIDRVNIHLHPKYDALKQLMETQDYISLLDNNVVGQFYQYLLNIMSMKQTKLSKHFGLAQHIYKETVSLQQEIDSNIKSYKLDKVEQFNPSLFGQ